MTTMLPPGVKLGTDSKEGEVLSTSGWPSEPKLPQSSGVQEVESAGQTKKP